jgi:hypothetical protein
MRGDTQVADARSSGSGTSSGAAPPVGGHGAARDDVASARKRLEEGVGLLARAAHPVLADEWPEDLVAIRFEVPADVARAAEGVDVSTLPKWIGRATPGPPVA